MSNEKIEQLASQAGELANAGRWAEAESTWEQVLALSPHHPKALFSLGMHALQRADLVTALLRLEAARFVAPTDLLTLLSLASAYQRVGEAEAERQAIDAALAVNAYFLPALLARAGWQERFATPATAAETYRNVLKIAPPESRWPAAMRPQMEHARLRVAEDTRALEAHLQGALVEAQSALPTGLSGRWLEAVAVMAGRTRPYLQQCNQLHVPRLPPIPFHDRAQFPWIAELERHTGAIRQELLAALQGERQGFEPYIAYQPGDPVNQWAELNHSLRWSSLHLWRGGEAVTGNLLRFPQTAAALAGVPRVKIDGLCPNAMFSALAPKTQIPPHHGETNARLVAHLPLVVPPGCAFRVGYETREWVEGEVLVFDDTIEHEARNDSEQLRVVLIFDVWNPLLAAEEQAMVQAMTRAAREYRG